MNLTSNPGATEMKSLEELRALGEEAVGVEAVTLKEILDTVPASTVIIKLDIEGFECKVAPSRCFRDLAVVCRHCSLPFCWEPVANMSLSSSWSGLIS